jgi:hypothetical protein
MGEVEAGDVREDREEEEMSTFESVGQNRPPVGSPLVPPTVRLRSAGEIKIGDKVRIKQKCFAAPVGWIKEGETGEVVFRSTKPGEGYLDYESRRAISEPDRHYVVVKLETGELVQVEEGREGEFLKVIDEGR